MSSNQDGANKQQNKASFSYTFKQQIMKAWQPVPTLESTIVLFCILTIFFLVFGIVLLSYSNQIKEYSVRYDDTCGQNPICTVTLNVEDDMDSPVFVYYELDNFYQNHRRYVQSRSIDQLQGDDVTATDLSTSCDPIVYNSDLGFKFAADQVTPLVGSAVANPCGLIAKSLFNDTYTLTGPTAVTILGTGIAWPSDQENKFKRNKNWKTVQWTDVEDQRFMVWMRTAALPYFRKLWGRIQKKVTKGQYTVSIANNYDVSKFDGQQTFVLSTANAFGGQNQFLSIAYLVVGGICLLISIGFIVRKFSAKSAQKQN